MKVNLCRMVIFEGYISRTGAYEHPAVITSKHGDVDTINGPAVVNLMVLPDGETPFSVVGVMLYDTARDAAQHCQARQRAYAPERTS